MLCIYFLGAFCQCKLEKLRVNGKMQRWLNLKIGAHFFSLGSEFESPHSSLLICPQYFCAFKEIMSRDFPPQPRTGRDPLEQIFFVKIFAKPIVWYRGKFLSFFLREETSSWSKKKKKEEKKDKKVLYKHCKNCLSRCIVVDFMQKR